MATVQPFQGQRLTYRISASFDTVVDRLRRQLHPQGLPISESPMPHAYAQATAGNMNAITFKRFWENRIGPSGFTYFFETEYGRWMPLFGIGGGQKAKRFIIGNPLIAAGIIKYDLNACLAVPVELLVREANGAVEVTYNLPSSLIVNETNAQSEELRAATAGLDQKLAALVENITAV